MNFLLKLEQIPFCVWLRESDSVWAFPMFLFLHTLSMSIVAGLSATLDLVFLGFWPKLPTSPLERLYGPIWLGFWISTVTGVALTVADATTRLTNPVFYVKMAFVFGGVWLLALMRKRVFHDPELDHKVLPSSAKVLAWASLVCWLGAITAGRLLAYLGPVAGLGNINNQ
jgi:hypothetical protein